MAENERRCPKCGGALKPARLGYMVLDASWGPALPLRCLQGREGRSFWRGRKTLEIEREYAVESFRCEACGYLEHYATEEIREER